MDVAAQARPGARMASERRTRKSVSEDGGLRWGQTWFSVFNRIALGDTHKPEAILPSLTPFAMEKTNLPVTNNESDTVKTVVKTPK